MFMIVVATFAIFWLPYQVYFVYIYHDSSLKSKPYVQHLFMVFYWLAMSYAMVNPLIYFWMNKRFRAYLCRLFRCCVPQNTLECFVPEPQQYYGNGLRSGLSRRSHPASERVKLEPTSSTVLPSGASPILLHSSNMTTDGWPPRSDTSRGTRRLLTLPTPRVGGGRRATGQSFHQPMVNESAPSAHWRRRDSEVSDAFMTPETSPPSARPLTQVRLLMRLAPAPSPALTLALGSLGTTPAPTSESGGGEGGDVVGKGEEDEGEDGGKGEAMHLLASDSCNSLDEQFYDASS
ncbi:tachykinin-like peptides receptor 99D [Amphibalanus amphitrite]|uniref:tachykinin-like peptides receptor 99D n=1 Tax=Amphibalanus amphitrite TaxID=1232801 RepID=UPI001C919ADD|nr:tachykinin-like peptides receptor 99D [Amphibalanus amphitrite]